MINKVKMSKPAKVTVKPRSSGGAQGGGGPDNYDGREKKNAGTPPPQDNYFNTPGTQVKGED